MIDHLEVSRDIARKPSVFFIFIGNNSVFYRSVALYKRNDVSEGQGVVNLTGDSVIDLEKIKMITYMSDLSVE